MKIPGYEPVELDLEKLFLLSVSKENLDFRGNREKNLPYKILKKYFSFLFLTPLVRFCFFNRESSIHIHQAPCYGTSVRLGSARLGSARLAVVRRSTHGRPRRCTRLVWPETWRLAIVCRSTHCRPRRRTRLVWPETWRLAIVCRSTHWPRPAPH